MKLEIRKIFVVIVFIWFGVSVARTFLNAGKFVFLESPLLLANEHQKRQQTYGDLYDFCVFASTNSDERSTIYFLSNDVQAFYFCRYQVYPRKMFLLDNTESLTSARMSKNNYLLFLETNDMKLSQLNKEGLKLISKFDKASRRGAIYKK